MWEYGISVSERIFYTFNVNDRKKIVYADDDYESIGELLTLRSPSLVVGLLLGTGISFLTSSFEEVLSRNVQVAFFLPFIVYVADAIGTQTQSIYARDLRTGKARFGNYLRKEFALGVVFGSVFGVLSGSVVVLWLADKLLAISVASATLIAIATAPLVALVITQMFQLLGRDPAAGSGPVATVVQDMASVLIYGIVASNIML